MEDKLYTIDPTIMTEWADIIREKQGIEDKLKPAELLEQTKEIVNGEDYGLQLLNKTITEIPSSWRECTKIREYAFYNCDSITTVVFPNVESIDSYAFAYCDSITTVVFPNVESIDSYAFAYCDSITTVVIPKCTTLDRNVFTGNTKIEVLDMPSLTTLVSYPNYGNAFEGCSSLHTLNAPLIKSIPSNTFSGCLALKKVHLLNVTSVSNWGFANSGIESIFLPSWKHYVQNNTFTNCKNLAVANLPSILGIFTLGFVNCTNLTTLILSQTTMVTLGATDAFKGASIQSGTGYIYVPSALIEEYKIATNWVTYADQFRAIEEYRDIIEPIFLEDGYEYDWGIRNDKYRDNHNTG